MRTIRDQPGRKSTYFLADGDQIFALDGDDLVYILLPMVGSVTGLADGGADTDSLFVDLRQSSDPVTFDAGDKTPTLRFAGSSAVEIRDFEFVEMQLGSGDDRIILGATRDEIRTGAGDDYISLGDGFDKASGGAGNDTIFGGAGDDTLDGYGDNDQLHGGTGNDQIDGWSGNDTIFSTAGADTIAGDEGYDTLIYSRSGTQSSIEFDAATGRFTRDGGLPESEVSTVEEFAIYTGFGADTVKTGDGDDVISTGVGDDVLIGGKGADYLQGGYGNDHFVFTFDDTTTEADPVVTSAGDIDRIGWFEGAGAADGDKIDVSGIGFFQGLTTENVYTGGPGNLMTLLTAQFLTGNIFTGFETRYVHVLIDDAWIDASAYTVDDLILV